MTGNLNETQEIGLLKYLAELTSISDLENLLDLIARKTPALLDFRGCSIYLTPEFVQESTDILIDAGFTQISSKQIKDEIIVLAQTNNEKKRGFLGKIFYASGSDLTGWVFQTGRILNCKNSRDPDELSRIQDGLKPSTRYLELDPEDEPHTEAIPILYVPLIVGVHTIGVLKLHRPNNRNEFSHTDEKFATIVAQVIASNAQKIQIMSHQEKQIFELSELGAEKNPDEVIKRVTKQASELFNCPKVEFYRKTGDGDAMELEVINGETIIGPKDTRYRKKEGFIGWVHKTGASVYLGDLRDFIKINYFDDSILTKISDTTEINDKDRSFVPLNTEFITEMKTAVPFMAAPVMGFDGSVQGVLCAHFLTSRHARRQKPFDFVELQRLKTFANTISLALQFDLYRKREQFLLDLSRQEDLLQFFDMVAENIPTLIHGTDCFIYGKENNGDGIILKLMSTNKELLDMSYEIGKGKTGFTALVRKTLVIDHIGSGRINEKKTENLKEKLKHLFPNDLVANLFDETNNCVGIIRLRSDIPTGPSERWLFKELCGKQAVYYDNGLPSEYLDKYIAMGSSPSFSFVAAPIGSDDGNLTGVITVARPADETPFSLKDIEFLESIAKTLSHLINIVALQEHRKELFINLAHEINTYLTPLLADAENIRTETARGSDLGNMGDHLLGQVNRLQVMTETILAVFSDEMPKSNKEPHSIYRPLMDAIVMFRDEAKIRGCDILEPIAVGFPRFPDIEMNLFEITLAFKNIIHNAIKYSYSPSHDVDRSRFIKIKCEWLDSKKKFYCVDIQDYGVGISSEEITNRNIFKPFQRGANSTDRNRTGSGIGLAFVEKIVVERHNGRVLVESVPQHGGAHLTTFRVALPINQPKIKEGVSHVPQ